jgi:hypothetical protein
MSLHLLLSARFFTNLISFHEFALIEGWLVKNKAFRHLSVLASEHYTIAPTILIQLPVEGSTNQNQTHSVWSYWVMAHGDFMGGCRRLGGT